MSEPRGKETTHPSSLGGRIREVVEKMGEWIDAWLPQRPPVLAPVPVRRRRR